MFVFAMSLRRQPQTLSRMALGMLSLATGLSITVAALPGVPRVPNKLAPRLSERPVPPGAVRGGLEGPGCAATAVRAKANACRSKEPSAGAGGAAHLPGMTASLTPLPVIGVPVKSSNSIDGWDSVLSILQMPAGVPVATVALNGARNAGILAAQIIGCHDPLVMQKLVAFKEELKAKVMDSVHEMNKK